MVLSTQFPRNFQFRTWKTLYTPHLHSGFLPIFCPYYREVLLNLLVFIMGEMGALLIFSKLTASVSGIVQGSYILRIFWVKSHLKFEITDFHRYEMRIMKSGTKHLH